MTDPRRHPANSRVADDSLRGQIKGVELVTGHLMQVGVPVADLRRAPDGPRDRQLLFGQTVVVLETYQGWTFLYASPSGYVGYVRADALSDPSDTTHWVTARATHIYSEPDFKSAERYSLSFGAALNVTGDTGQSDRFYETPEGFVPKAHVQGSEFTFRDPVDAAALLLGTPYLWGGDSAFGIDCSGLVQLGCRACGIPCPGDSDMQEAELGMHLPEGAPLRRGDLLFWKGHVAWVADPETLLHANAFHMATAYEPLQDAVKRIERQGDGPVTTRKRLGEIT